MSSSAQIPSASTSDEVKAKAQITKTTVIRLHTRDEKFFHVEFKAAILSGTIKEILDEFGITNEKKAKGEIVEIHEVDGPVLEKILEWVNYHKDDPNANAPEDDFGCLDNICEWDVEFLKIETSLLFELVTAAKYLKIQGLVKICCKSLAKMITGKTPEELRNFFRIQNDYLPEEEEAVRKENQWCEEIEEE